MEEIRNELLNLFDGDEQYVDEFLDGVNETNARALLRVARSLVVNRSTETEEEVVEDAVGAVETEEEETVEEETVEDDAVAEAEENANEEEIVSEEAVEENEVLQIELHEDFINDLIGSPEFRSVMASAIAEEFNKFSATFEEKLRSFTDTVEAEREWIQDVPQRQKRAVVSYRPRTEKENGSGVNGQETSYEDIAAETVSSIFD